MWKLNQAGKREIVWGSRGLEHSSPVVTRVSGSPLALLSFCGPGPLFPLLENAAGGKAYITDWLPGFSEQYMNGSCCFASATVFC